MTKISVFMLVSPGLLVACGKVANEAAPKSLGRWYSTSVLSSQSLPTP